MVGGSKQMRLLMANEPRAYREVIAEAIRDLRPGVKIVAVDSGEIDECIAGFGPDMVICSAATEAVKNALVWIELYPEFSQQSVVSVRGEVSKVEEIQLVDLLAIVDRTRQLVQKS